MNALQTFMNTGNTQARPTNQEAFTIEGDPTVYYGTFGDPQLIPVMTRQGYQDHLVTQLIAQASLFATPPVARVNLTRTATGRVFFVHMVDATEVVVYNFMLTDRSV